MSLHILLIFQAEFGKRIHLNSQFAGTERLPNTCNFSILGPQLQGDDCPQLSLAGGWGGLGWAQLELWGGVGAGRGRGRPTRHCHVVVGLWAQLLTCAGC